jgi:hypothetical protein
MTAVPGVGIRSRRPPDHAQPHQCAVLLNHVCATRLTPEGRPYTLTEVSKGTGLSVPSLSILRKGTMGAVPLQRVAALARFFGVSLDLQSGDIADREPRRAGTADAGPATEPGSRAPGGEDRHGATGIGAADDRTCRAHAPGAAHAAR